MSNKLKNIAPEELFNAVKMIGKEWMIICAADPEKETGASGMTASWGCLGVLWGKPVCVCFIRPQRHTFGLAENEDRMSFNFFGNGEEYREALKYFGTKSGRDTDKTKDMGLTIDKKEIGGEAVPYFSESKTVLFGRKLYADDLKKANFIDKSLFSHYPNDDFHRVYVCEIEEAIGE